MTKTPLRIAVTGAAGQIGYSLLFRIAAGDMLGKDQPVILQLLDLPQALKACDGVMMELADCAFPLLAGVFATDQPDRAFKDADICLLVGGRPRGPGMERADLLTANASIFALQGRSIAENANPDVKVLVVGNPANTNAYITRQAALKVGRTNPANYHGMLRLDHNRALSMMAAKINCPVDALSKMVIWGNHSPTMYTDARHCCTNGTPVFDLIGDPQWNADVFLPVVAQRGTAIIAARGLSSAASAANAAINHVHDWVLGSKDWVTMGVPSDGSYGIPEGLIFGFPCECSGGSYRIIQGIPLDAYAQDKINTTLHELVSESQTVKAFY